MEGKKVYSYDGMNRAAGKTANGQNIKISFVINRSK
jgi:hypothetical protein|tara:strand:+ start:1351 stop:1458 length:108 start_codon:yes stop_codon:yes gene_type:complete